MLRNFITPNLQASERAHSLHCPADVTIHKFDSSMSDLAVVSSYLDFPKNWKDLCRFDTIVVVYFDNQSGRGAFFIYWRSTVAFPN